MMPSRMAFSSSKPTRATRAGSRSTMPRACVILHTDEGAHTVRGPRDHVLTPESQLLTPGPQRLPPEVRGLTPDPLLLIPSPQAPDPRAEQITAERHEEKETPNNTSSRVVAFPTSQNLNGSRRSNSVAEKCELQTGMPDRHRAWRQVPNPSLMPVEPFGHAGVDVPRSPKKGSPQEVSNTGQLRSARRSAGRKSGRSLFTRSEPPGQVREPVRHELPAGPESQSVPATGSMPPGASGAPGSSSEGVSPSNVSLIGRLVDQGVAVARARALVAEMPAERIVRQLEWIGRRSCRDRAATLVRAIVDDFGEPARARGLTGVNGFDRAKFFRGAYAVCPSCGSRPCAADCSAEIE